MANRQPLPKKQETLNEVLPDELDEVLDNIWKRYEKK